MKARTIIDLLTLSSNLYLIAKDKELFERLREVADKGKEGMEGLFSEFGEEGEDAILEKIIRKAKQAKEEFELKMEEVAASVYRKMHIAHADDLSALRERIDMLERELRIAETRVNGLEARLSQL